MQDNRVPPGNAGQGQERNHYSSFTDQILSFDSFSMETPTALPIHDS